MNGTTKKFSIAIALLALGFFVPLWKLAMFAAHDQFQSYVLIMPFVCGYLFSLQKNELPKNSAPAKIAGAIFFAAGIAVLIWHLVSPAKAVADNFAQITLSFVLLVNALGFFILGGAAMRAAAFPFAMLIFMIPMPDWFREMIENQLQYGSAIVAGWMFSISDVPFLQDNVVFRLPGINLQVAPECSGIHSTMVLFITSLVAAHFFLRRNFNRALLCLAILPLALLRNGFRIFVLGELCTHIGPQMIDSPIHHHGGPIFFALSLVPFLLLLYWLKRSERPKPNPVKS